MFSLGLVDSPLVYINSPDESEFYSRQSYGNIQEIAKINQVLRVLIDEDRVPPEKISVLTPYYLQMSLIKSLCEYDVETCSIDKYQVLLISDINAASI